MCQSMATAKLTHNVSILDSIEPLDMVKGNTDLNSPVMLGTIAFDFRPWAISYVKNHQALDVSAPAFRTLVPPGLAAL